MTQPIWVLIYTHRHDTDISVWPSEAAAFEARAEMVMTNILEVKDEDVRRAIEDAYENDDFVHCYSIYNAEVDDETLTIEECFLHGAKVNYRILAIDTQTELAHRVHLLPFAGTAGVYLCSQRFFWLREGGVAVGAGFAYLPKKPSILSCMQCIVAEANEQAPT